MKITLDREADAAYVYLCDKTPPGSAARTVSVSSSIILDYDAEGHLLGIEILGALRLLHPDAIRDSVDITEGTCD